MRQRSRSPAAKVSSGVKLLLVIGVLIWGELVAPSAQSATPPTRGSRPRRVATATRVHHSLRIDGQPSEEAWKQGVTQGGFFQREPHDGAAATFSTEFCILYDEDALYIGVYAHDPDPRAVRGLLTRRDKSSSSDWIWVALDSYHDRRTAFAFALNPASVQQDCIYYDDGTNVDCGWDATWQGAAARTSFGWFAEFRIPFSQLRFSRQAEPVWGLQVERVTQRKGEDAYWTPWPKKSSGQVSLYGELVGLKRHHRTWHLEAVPYGLLGVSHRPGAQDPVSPVANLGLDLTIALRSNVMLSAAVNPDFGQVEADPSIVNLTADETFFPEKRPFFLEGIDIFRFRLSQGDGDSAVEELFYSRRIGAPPRGTITEEVEDERDLSLPRKTMIYGAVKLSGKTAGGWSLGGLNAITASEEVSYVNARGEQRTTLLEPLTSYTVLGIHKDFWAGRSRIGAVATAIHRALAGTDLETLHDQAYAGGLLLSHRFLSDRWLLQAKVLGSFVRGSAAAMAETQQAAQRYYQRPDATHLSFDPERTCLYGISGQYMFGRFGGQRLRGALGGDTRTPGFEVNDLGFQYQADYLTQWGWLQLREDQPGSLLRDFRINLNGWGSWNYGGRFLSTGGNVNLYGRLLSYWSGTLGISYNLNQWRTRALRGGPALRGVPSWSGWASLDSDSRRALVGQIGASWQVLTAGSSWNAEAWSTISWQVLSNLEVSLGPSYKRNRDDTQFVQQAADDAGTTHYILGRIDQTILGLTLRLDYTFTPALSLQLYLQPYLSAGHYLYYQEATAPQAAHYAERFTRIDDTQLINNGDEYGVDRDGDGRAEYAFAPGDFNFRELHANVVFRWEYLPGSTLFFLWSYGRTSETSAGRFDLSSDLRGLFTQLGEQRAMIKLTYHFST